MLNQVYKKSGKQKKKCISETVCQYTMLKLQLIERKASWWYRNAYAICIAVVSGNLKRQKNVAAVGFFSTRDAYEPT
jgi:hypothetical protein